MFVITKGEEKKNRFITHYKPSKNQEIKLNPTKPHKIQSSPKINEKEKEKDEIKIIEKNNNIIIPPQIPKNLFCILHNQKTPIAPAKFTSPHLKKKRFIDDDTGNTIGRWSRDEHKKFIEAIIKFGNNWKEVQEYVNTRTSTQARSHAQKFFEKIKKNNTLKFFDSLNSDYSENFTNATILQLHNSYGKKSKGEINSIVNKFLSLEYDLPKKRRKMISNNLNGISRKKNYRKNIENEVIVENDNEDEQDENEDNMNDNNNNYDNENDYNRNYNNYNENIKNVIQNNIIIENGYLNNIQDYSANNINDYNENFMQKHNNIYNYNYPQNPSFNYNPNDINYIISQFVNNLSSNICDINPNDPRLKPKRKNTFESIEENSYMGQVNNLGTINNQNNYNYTKSRKNSVDSINKFIQNDRSDFNDFYKKLFEIEESNQNKQPFEDFRNQNVLEDDLTMNLLKNIK